ncbi:MAG TPA: MBL fold metallo-hydrolase [Bauldia sp.]|nr:MBL fold metallo-hydrolase [Bauldia sp.]
MSATLRITVLGCGSSPGVPRIGNDWGACDPNEPRNRRTRTSILIERVTEAGATRVLVDTGPDLRQQLLAADVRAIDAVVYTHAHADHVHGIDDLRAFWLNTHRLVEVYADAPTAAHLRHAFGYCFATQPGSNYPPILRHNPISAGMPFAISGAGGSLAIVPFRQIHGEIESLGLRVGTFAYSCDISDLPPESVPEVEGADLWIVDALRPRPHPSHFSLAEAVAWIQKLRVRRGVLTHMHNDLDYATTRQALPAGIEPAYDGMVVELPLAG